MQEIHKNGYWNAETAHLHHVHSPKLAQWLIQWVKSKVDGDLNTPINDFGCFTENTLIETPNGKILIKDLQIGDTIYGHNFEEVIILNKFERVSTNRVNIHTTISEGDFSILETTSEHPILGIKRNTIQKLKYKDANRTSVCQEHEKQELFENPQFIRCENLCVGDFVAIPRFMGNLECVQIARLLGYYMSEGSIMYSHPPHIGGIRFSFNISELDYIEEVKELSMSLGCTSVTIKERPNKNITEVMAFGKEFATKIYNLGGKLSRQKKLSQKIRLWDNNSKLNLIRTWLNGDGNSGISAKSKNSLYHRGRSASLILLKNMQTISRDIGMNPYITWEKNTQVGALVYMGKDAEIINETISDKIYSRKWRKSEKYIFTPIKKIVNILEPTTVYNLEVSNTHTYIANEIAVHNCGIGDYLKAFQEAGFTTLMGFEGEPPVKKSFPHIRQQDLTVPFDVNPKGVCIFLEVAEHIPSKQCEIAVQNVINACEKYLILSWAIKGQAGFGHVNCLNNDEVIAKIQAKGFKYLEQDSMDARANVDDFAPWFKNTIMIFERI